MENENKLPCVPEWGESGVPDRKRLGLQDHDKLEEDKEGYLWFRGRKLAFAEERQ